MSRKRYRPEEVIGKQREEKGLVEKWRRHYNRLRPQRCSERQMRRMS